MSLLAKDLRLRLGNRWVLQGVSLEVKPGELLALLGPNGAGKSSLLRALAGEWPIQGLYLDGVPLSKLCAVEQARKRSVLPQQAQLDFPLTALEVVLLGRNPHIQHEESLHDYQIARLAMGKTATLHLQERNYTTLSGGERQRVMLAKALAQIWEPTPQGARYLLLDEPTVTLDPAHQHQTLIEARELATQGVGVLAVLHDLNLAATYADQIAILHHGKIVDLGSPSRVLQPATIAKVFGLQVELHNHHAHSRPLVMVLGPIGQGHGIT